MSALLIGLIVGGIALVVALIWAVIDNLFIYKRKGPRSDGHDGGTNA